jgi:hypothetical protein
MIAPTRERTERLLEKSGRITPREVLEAYEETGLTPKTGSFVTDAGEACGIGVVAIRHVESLAYAFARYMRQRGVNRPVFYASGFANAFDGHAQQIPQLTGESYKTGYRDGQRVRRFVEAKYGGLS